MGGGIKINDYSIESPLRDDIATVSDLINILIDFLIPFAILILFLMFVYTGYTFLTSRGNPEKIKQARGIITSALIGFVLLVMAFFIVRIIGTIFNFSGGILGL